MKIKRRIKKLIIIFFEKYGRQEAENNSVTFERESQTTKAPEHR